MPQRRKQRLSRKRDNLCFFLFHFCSAVQEFDGLGGGHGPVCGGGDHLTDLLGPVVAGHEDAGRPGAAVLACGCVAGGGQVDETAEVLILRDSAHGHEQALDLDGPHGAVQLVGDLDGGQPLVVDQPGHGGIVDELHVVPLLQPGDGGVLAPELVPAVDQIDLVGQIRQIEGVLQGGVAAAHHGHVPAAEEVAVAGGAVGDAAAHQQVLALHAQLPVLGAGGQDQGSALIGPLNVHWKEKGYVDATEWIEFCSPVVSLARFPKFVYSNKDTLNVPVELYNAMYAEITNTRNNYYITDETQNVISGGILSVGDLPIGKNINIGKVSIPLDKITKPSKLTLSVLVAGKLRNHWDFWVYPEVKDTLTYDDIYQTDTLDSKALDVLKNGGKVLIAAAGKVRLGRDIVQHYLPVFWNTSWFQMRPPHTTGAYIDKSHPLFKYDFPTDDWSNLNWWELLNKAQVMNLMELPLDYQPPIQPIDTWHISRKLGMLIEANVLKGKLLMTTMDISSDLDNRLVARQMRQAILRYMQSDDFKPAITLQPQIITDFFTKDGPKVDMHTKASPADLKPQINPNK